MPMQNSRLCPIWSIAIIAMAACGSKIDRDTSSLPATDVDVTDSSGGELSTGSEHSPTSSEPVVGVCGDGLVDENETCDDGNTADGDACPSGEVGRCLSVSFCGDGIVRSDTEVCDDGNSNDSDGCPSGDIGQCFDFARCGDGIVWKDVEACDDGNFDDNDSCPSDAGACLNKAFCGDGFIWPGQEDCDDLNLAENDECSNACFSPRWIFVTSKNPSSTGNLGGLLGADEFCTVSAQNADLTGEFIAWLTDPDPSTAPAFRLESTQFRGWYLLPTKPPTPIAQGWDDLVNPNEDDPQKYLQNAINSDEFGSPAGNVFVWTNTGADGHQHEFNNTCSGWKMASDELSGVAGRSESGLATSAWTDWTSLDCTTGHRLYCVQKE